MAEQQEYEYVAPEEQTEEQHFISPTEVKELTKFLVEDKSIPKERAEKNWGFSNKEVALSHFDSSDAQILSLHFDVASLLEMMQKPDFKNDWNQVLEMENHRTDWFMRVRRAKQGFERKMQATQIRHLHSSRGSMGEEKKRNIISRLGAGLFGIGGRS